jgi:ubiquinone/menaquinone biosynthesis C-methylase UbiE
MDAQNLQFSDDSFDHVVGTVVLCSVFDPAKAAEMKIVLKKVALF